MALPPAFLDELRARTPLAPLVGRRTRLVRNGRIWKACCPFHNEKSPSFYVYDDHYHCFGCGAHGDAISFLMQTDGAAFPEAVERLAAEAGMEVPRPSREEARRAARARDLHGVLEAAAAVFARRLRLPEGRAALDYLRGRGLTEETIAGFGLGWSGGGRGALVASLREEGIEPAQLVEAGLVRQPEEGGALSEFFFNRVMFPIRDARGRMIGFGGRIMGEGQPKYLNTPETPVFAKRRSLYALDRARESVFRGRARLLVVEGYMDVIALHQAGLAGAVAPLGTALTEDQLQALWQVSPEPCLCFDGDAAGGRAAARAVRVALPLLSPERTLRIATLPAGEDPDTLVKANGPRAMEAVLEGAAPLEDALFRALAAEHPGDGPAQRAALRNAIVAAAAQIPDRALAAEMRSALLNRFFAGRPDRQPGRRGEGRGRPAGGAARLAAPSPRMPPRLAIDPAEVRLSQARMLLAILLRHPWMLPEVEEALTLLDFQAPRCDALRDALLGWLAGAEVLDSEGLMNHLAQAGLAEDAGWTLGVVGLPPAAREDAQPKEALDGWWHFFAQLRGGEHLEADLAEARHHWIATNDPVSAQRMKRLAEAIEALRRHEAEAVSEH
ncbi:DNA primase [Roseomonas sp. NAR14]|uniref:DNA primase n=1 Tax=Roseomonas acroporae TaxID=2937791 RepID=A0A9X1YAZ1_9PROT|nr:DNA primase [Roseomonas acroporae]MCK8786382.1 DNA primase [Roseomonas acroporae]